MLCKCCREDLPKANYSDRAFKAIILHGSTQYCLECEMLSKKQKKAKAFAAIAAFNLPPSKRKLKVLRAGADTQDARWRSLTFEEKRLDLIRRQTPSERALAEAMRVAGIEFEPQIRVFNFYIDFQVLPHQIAIEVDGGYHFTREQQGQDERRDKTLRKNGWVVLRFTNERVRDDLPGVIAEIQARLDSNHPMRQPRALAPRSGVVVIPPVARESAAEHEAWLNALARQA
jgi:very-short-patch-repair endonuclease